MQPRRGAALGIVLAALVGGGDAAAQRRISPGLHPKADKKFFGPPFPADYPSDVKASATTLSKHFTHPYPEAQESGVYDDDFVKDENGDSGEWQAQFHYDTLRNKLVKEREDLAKAEAKKAEKERDLDGAKAASKRAEEEHAKALEEDRIEVEKNAEAEKAAAAAAKKAEEAEKAKDVPHGDTPMDKDVKQATQNLETKITNLAGCKKELEEAQKQLEVVLEKQVEAQKKQSDATAAKQAQANENASAAQAALEESKAEQGAVEHKLEEARKHKESKKGALNMAKEMERSKQRDYEVELKSYSKEVQEVAQVESELKAAEEKVRSLRRKVDTKGAVTRDSGALAAAPPLALAALLTAAACLA